MRASYFASRSTLRFTEMSKREELRKRIREQSEYIRALRDREFSTIERRMEVVGSAVAVAVRLQVELLKERKLNKMKSRIVEAMVSGAILIIYAIASYLAFCFVSWSWELGETPFLLWRTGVTLLTFILVVVRISK